MPELVRTVGRYGILRELGRGGMAVVYLARQTDLDRLVALKELAAFHAADADFARRFVRESRLAGSLVHPNVITVFDYFEHDGTPYIAMEYVDRGSLRPYVGRMTLAQIGGVLDGLLAGLAEAEQHNIVHRDLKPENLMVTSTGTVKIADFGIAKATQAADTAAFLTATGTTVGTPPYMAPEQAMAKDVGPWTDLYSVGCMAYELFTGKPPFYDTDEPLAILLRHISEALPPASEVADVDPEISAWIERLTAKDPKSRPESATAAWEEFEEILIGQLGPRWRREARLPEPPNRGAERHVEPARRRGFGRVRELAVGRSDAGARPGDAAAAHRARAADGGDRRRGDRARTRAATCPPPRSRSTRPTCRRRPARRRSRGSTSRGPARIPGATCPAPRRRSRKRRPLPPAAEPPAAPTAAKPPAPETEESDFQTYLPPPDGLPPGDAAPPAEPRPCCDRRRRPRHAAGRARAGRHEPAAGGRPAPALGAAQGAGDRRPAGSAAGDPARERGRARVAARARDPAADHGPGSLERVRGPVARSRRWAWLWRRGSSRRRCARRASPCPSPPVP